EDTVQVGGRPRLVARIEDGLHQRLEARRGKLVLDEYFHGFHRDRTHDTRSSGKTLTAMMMGIAMDQGAPVSPASRVLDLFADEESLKHVDERKRALTVHHLLSMQSGFDCDDNSWETPGNEDRMQSQDEQPDWIRYCLDLPMVREPGAKGVYCTAGINLAAGTIERVTGIPTLNFFDEFYAQPLGIHRYHMNLDPLDRAYGGGGVRLRPRDHLKLGQLLVSGGRWQGRQIVSSEWIQAMGSPHASLYATDDYGYGTWRRSLSHDGKETLAIYASGNGGQYVIAIPSEELVVLFTAGNYMDFRTWSGFLTDLVPAYVPAALDG
ncbi:MAG: serine hydrolase, partial [Planctomycetota bacterium]